jgi:hypothetical protein
MQEYRPTTKKKKNKKKIEASRLRVNYTIENNAHDM